MPQPILNPAQASIESLVRKRMSRGPKRVARANAVPVSHARCKSVVQSPDIFEQRGLVVTGHCAHNCGWQIEFVFRHCTNLIVARVRTLADRERVSFVELVQKQKRTRSGSPRLITPFMVGAPACAGCGLRHRATCARCGGYKANSRGSVYHYKQACRLAGLHPESQRNVPAARSGAPKILKRRCAQFAVANRMLD